MADEYSDAIRTALSKELLEREYLNRADYDCKGPGPKITAKLTPNQPKDVVTYTWRSPIQSYTTSLQPSVSELAKAIADGLGYAAPRTKSTRSLMDLARETMKIKSPLTPIKQTRIAIGDVTGGSKQANTILRYALLAHLRRAGFAAETNTSTKTSTAPYRLLTEIHVSKPKPANDGSMMQDLRIVWTIKALKGKQLGTLELADALPSKILKTSWRQVSDAIAGTGAGGIAKILDRNAQQSSTPISKPTS